MSAQFAQELLDEIGSDLERMEKDRNTMYRWVGMLCHAMPCYAVSTLLYPLCCIHSAVSTLLYPLCCIHSAVSILLYPYCCIHTAVSTLYPLCCIHTAVSTLLYPYCCIHSAVSTLLYPYCCIHSAVSTLLYPLCCIHSAVSTLLYPLCCIHSAASLVSPCEGQSRRLFVVNAASRNCFIFNGAPLLLNTAECSCYNISSVRPVIPSPFSSPSHRMHIHTPPLFML